MVGSKMDEFDQVMSVNVYGPWRMTRAFAPLITASKGRIVNIGSINGIVAAPQAAAYGRQWHTWHGSVTHVGECDISVVTNASGVIIDVIPTGVQECLDEFATLYLR